MLSFSCVRFSSINIEVADRELLAIVGQVGCGKSSLISTMLGETRKLQGQVTLKVCVWDVLVVSFLKTTQSEKITIDHFYERKVVDPPQTNILKLRLVLYQLKSEGILFRVAQHM